MSKCLRRIFFLNIFLTLSPRILKEPGFLSEPIIKEISLKKYDGHLFLLKITLSQV